MKNIPQYQIDSSVNEEILEIILTGEESLRTMEKNMKSDMDNIIIESKIKNVLVDCRALEGRLGIAETYEWKSWICLSMPATGNFTKTHPSMPA